MTNLGLLIACAAAVAVAAAGAASAGAATIEGKWCVTSVGRTSLPCNVANTGVQISRVGHSWFVSQLASTGAPPDKMDVLDADDKSIAFVDTDEGYLGHPGATSTRFVCQLIDNGIHLACQQTSSNPIQYSGPSVFSRTP
ncbi:MAG: hypothetical protein KGJ66_03065 [Alphaproteobacteria bacterium]|nr:hypothetical protein [Alphaproteobacteria bacterium]